jgi:NADH-quinone oxidoreductase subunit M
MLALQNANFPPQFQHLWFPFVFLGFAVLGGIFPFHNWSPDGHWLRRQRFPCSMPVC